MEMEEYGWVADFLPDGRSSDRMREPIAQLVGERHFTLLEVSIKQGSTVALEERIYIGKDERQQVEKIKRRVEFEELTAAAKNELNTVVKKIVMHREAEFVSFFNKSGSISIRLHQLELLPGIGKKHLEEILDQRDVKPFESFADMQARVPLLPDPMHVLVVRIVEEMHGDSKHYIFVRPPSLKREF